MDQDGRVIDPRTLLDDLLEILVVPSFTRTGYDIRRALFDWQDPESWSMAGRTVLLTGPTSGLGRAAAGSFARMGARLVLLGRDRERLEATADDLRLATPHVAIATVVADMADLVSVHAAAATVLATEARLDVLVDNAGAMLSTREVTDAGFERTFATMVLGPFVLVSRLLPRLRDTPGARVIAVTSGGMYTQRLPLDDLQFERGTYDGPRAYARAKRAQVALVREWARRSRDDGIAVNAMHPGWADTPGLEASLPGFRELVGEGLRDPAQGIDTLLWLAASPEAARSTGRLFLDRRSRPFDRIPTTRMSLDDRRRLWDLVRDLTGEPCGRTGDLGGRADTASP